MNFIDRYKNEIEENEYEEMTFDELIEQLQSEEFDKTDIIIKKMADIEVSKYVALDKELIRRGYEDKDERLRIIEIIY